MIPPVQVIIYAHGPADTLRASLASARLSFGGRDFIIVLEGGEPPDVGSCVYEFAVEHGSLVMENFDRLGYWKSVIKAWDRASGTYLVGLDAGVICPKNSLRELVDHLVWDSSLDMVTPLTSRSLFALRRSAGYRFSHWRHANNAEDAKKGPRVGVAEAWDHFQVALAPRLLNKSVLFLLSCSRDDSAVPLEVMELRECGVNAQGAVGPAGWRGLLQNVPEASEFCLLCETEDELVDAATRFDFVVATDLSSRETLTRAQQKAPAMIPMHYLQEYEPWSLADKARQQEAEHSFADGPNVRYFAASEWLCRTMWQRHRISVARIPPGLDRGLYNGFTSTRNDASKVLTIAAPIRPGALHGNAWNALRILRKVALKHGRAVDIRVFGCTEEELDAMDEARGFRFSSLGILKRNQIADVLRGADIFADLSTVNAVGRMGLEAMAVGCAAILPEEGGARNYAIDGENALMVDTSNEVELVTAFDRLIGDRDLRARLKKQATLVGRSHSIRRTALAEMQLFSESLGRAGN